MLDSFIATLCQEFGIAGSLATETRGIYQFTLEDGTKVFIREVLPGYTFSSTLTTLPLKNKETFLSEMMLANLFGKGTNGAVLGLDDSGNVLTLSQNVEYTSNYKAFKETLEDFANTVDFWKQQALEYNNK